MAIKDLLNKKVYSKPTEGHHTIVIKQVREVTGSNYEYLEFNTMLDGVREFKINMFERDLGFFQSALLKKIGIEGTTFGDLLNRAITNKEELDIWIRYNRVISTESDNNNPTTREFTNIYWTEPRATTTETTNEENDAEFLKAIADASNGHLA